MAPCHFGNLAMATAQTAPEGTSLMAWETGKHGHPSCSQCCKELLDSRLVLRKVCLGQATKTETSEV